MSGGWQADLCHANFGIGDTYPNRKYNPDTAVEDYRRLRAAAGDDDEARRRAIQDTAPALYFTCASESNGVTVFPCTGSAHKDGVVVTCSCACHRRPSVTGMMRAGDEELAAEGARLMEKE